MIAPVIPGLNDHEIPAILREARKAGAGSATYVLLRLPLAVADVFVEWLERAEPLRAAKVISRVRETRGGKLNCSTFGTRMRGEGSAAERIRERFRLFAAREGLDRELPAFDLNRFRRPDPDPDQLRLF
jgi:DNA repair photolyase